ncbi:larval cuticle protein A2B-like [Chelonus insularis]|uniref:larval cuticle protein A2B-like n=1 Tax=Chelonus insularis TaxID=460826 RepID=UPI00158A44DE|nr:larval cuticle protein A2B-like [Chelonus insularis]
MAYKVVLSIAIATIFISAKAAVVPVAPAAQVLAKIEDFDAVPQYSYAYDVQDALTGDSKAQYETRNGDVVQGSYSLIEADGTRRIVDYTADPVNGFNAVVNREPAVAVAPVVTKTAPVVAAPVAPAVAAPVAAPLFARSVAAPVVPAPVAPAVAAPVLARSVAAPVVASLPYTIPRAVATRLSAPVYPAPLNYAVAPTNVFV